jgi:hypothetical protein
LFCQAYLASAKLRLGDLATKPSIGLLGNSPTEKLLVPFAVNGLAFLLIAHFQTED